MPGDIRDPGPTLADRAQWMLRATPADYLLAMSAASAALPLVGKHFEPLGGYTAMGVWGYRHAPELLASAMKSWLRPGACNIRRGQREQTNFVSEAALRGVVPAADLDIEWPAPERAAPVLRRCSTAVTCIARRCATASTRRSCSMSGGATTCRRIRHR